MPWKDQATKARALELALEIPRDELGVGRLFHDCGRPKCFVGFLIAKASPDAAANLMRSARMTVDKLYFDDACEVEGVKATAKLFGWTRSEFDSVETANDGHDDTPNPAECHECWANRGHLDQSIEALRSIPVEVK